MNNTNNNVNATNNINNNVASNSGTISGSSQNVKANNLKRMVKSKGFVTAACAILAVAVLLVAYNLRINSATQPVRVPVASHRLTSRHLITKEDIRYISIPRGAISSDYYANEGLIIGNYVNYDTTIPEGSMFYRSSIISEANLPDSALLNLEDDESLYYLTVNMLSTLSNQILPGRYINLYIATSQDDKAVFTKFIENVKVLQVKTSDGLNVFEDSTVTRTPYVLYFALPKDIYLLMNDIETINAYSISDENSGFSSIRIKIDPTNVYEKEEEKKTKPEVVSQYLKDYILSLVAEIPEDVRINEGNIQTTITE